MYDRDQPDPILRFCNFNFKQSTIKYLHIFKYSIKILGYGEMGKAMCKILSRHNNNKLKSIF